MYYLYIIALVVIGIGLIFAAIGSLFWFVPNCVTLEERRGGKPDSWDWDNTNTLQGVGGMGGWTIGGFVVLIGIILCIVSACSVARAESEYVEYVEHYTMFTEMYDSGQDLANLGYTSTILHYNNWLVNARADVDTWGKHSRFYKYDLDSLNYITMRGEE